MTDAERAAFLMGVLTHASRYGMSAQAAQEVLKELEQKGRK